MLITGSNGFVGTQVARRAIADGHRVVALVRAGTQEEARLRLSRAWEDWVDLRDEIGGRVRVVQGDVTREDLGLGRGELESLASSIDHIIHAAATVRFDAPPETHKAVNVDGSRNVLDLARLIDREYDLRRLTHLSTAFVAGLYRGRIPEDHLSDAHGFANPYERSKFEAEALMREAGDDLPITVIRPSMIVGDSTTGEIRSFNTLYLPLRLYLTRRLRLLPIRGGTRLDLVPVDYVADSTVSLTFDPRAEGATFHITCPGERRPTVRQLMDEVRGWATDHMGIRLPRGRCVPLPRGLVTTYLRLLGRSSGDTSLAGLQVLAGYFDDRHDFLRENTDRLLGEYPHDWRGYLPRLLAFAVYRGFMHRTDRTVHEQILFRLESKRRPARLFDLIDGGEREMDSEAFRSAVAGIMAGLRSHGLGKGSRVGVVGTNSSRYLAIDVAVGLLGAVSVPMYFTSPPGEISDILRDSGASILLVGYRPLLDRIGKIDAGIPIVSFCEGYAPHGSIPWEEFVDPSITVPEMAPVDFGDEVTIRYTSSTTGKPKGVVFTHANLRWMAECIASIPPWEARNSEVTYLSFLPMNHVVEGILGAYSPFMAPAPMSIHFLGDIRRIPRALPAVRPTIFFSVPRFYENLWRRFEESRGGRRYLKAGGLGRKLLRGVTVNAFLSRSGLDRCRQLIVGSAPVSEGLLRAYRELGVEVHNAYGLTEAPLLTINRVGENRIGTVGRPLPQTHISISDEGEIMARGPQVMRGYHREPRLESGWLRTGDIGQMDDGYLTILGRAKEMIITSYGKNILPVHIEQSLKRITGVEEAMVVGDNRPFLTALLWVSGDTPDVEGLDEEVAAVNEGMSNPERVRRWAVLPMELSIEGGQQTANLKLRRVRIEEEYGEVIRFLYGEGDRPDRLIHLGRWGDKPQA